MPLRRKDPNGLQDFVYHLVTKDFVQSKLAVSGECYFAGIIMTAMNGDSECSITFNIYDSATAAASRKRLVPRTFKKIFEAGEDNHFSLSYDPPVRAANGIYVEITGIVGRIYYQVIYDQ